MLMQTFDNLLTGIESTLRADIVLDASECWHMKYSTVTANEIGLFLRDSWQ